jgi:PST family polysaccharide transporter
VKIVDNVGWLFLDKIVRMGMGLLVGVWVARYLGPQQFGLFSFASAFVALFITIASMGLQGIVVRDIVHNPLAKETTLGSAAVLHFFGGMLAYAMTMATVFLIRPDDPLARALVAILGSAMLFKPSEVAAYWFESQVLSKYTVWVQNGSFLVFVAIKVFLILQNASLIAFAWAAMSEALFAALLMLVAISLRGPKLRQLRANVKRIKELLHDSWPLLLSGMAIMTYMKIDQIMLGQMIGDEEVGIYSAALRISEVWYFIPMTIVASVFPAILETKMRSETLYYLRMQRLLDLMVWLSISIAIPMTFLSTPIVSLLFGDSFAKSGAVLAVHIWASVFVFLGVASGNWYLAEGRQILGFQRTLLGILVNVSMNLLLIPRYGAIGAAWATVVAQFSVGILFDAIQMETRRLFFMKARSFSPFRLLQILKENI